jgi:diguanylate cyclase (GGDEF)-like protein
VDGHGDASRQAARDLNRAPAACRIPVRAAVWPAGIAKDVARMTETLDVRTLLVAVGLAALLAAAGMASFARRYPQFRGIGWLALADLLLGLGMLLVATRDHAPEWLTTVVANLFTLGGLMLNAEGLRRYAGGRWPWWSRPYLLFAVLLPASAWFTFIEPDVRARVLVFTACAAMTLAVVGITLARSEAGPRLRLVAWAFVAFALLMLARWATTLLQAPMPSFMTAGVVHGLTLLAYLVFVMVKDYGILQDSVRRSLEHVAALARTDPLTGLLNRRAIDEVATAALARAQRSGAPLSLVMLDIDHFKQVNDVHGHAAGDAVLVGIANLLKAHTRAGDACARMGGEEFLVLLPDTGEAQAEQVAEALRARLAASAFGDVGACTASFGVSTGGVGATLDHLLRSADRALYRAKDAGRNRVVRA